jgi:tetratricopeptide (TPR) repeat protein
MLPVLLSCASLHDPTCFFAAGFTGRHHLYNQVFSMSASTDEMSSSSFSLSKIFNTALALHQSGDHHEAVVQYELFLEAAKSVGAPDESLAEVHCNLGQIKARKGDRFGAKESFMEALRHRSLATAHVNLALLLLAEGETQISGSKKSVLISVLEDARDHCEAAIASVDGTSERTVETAKRIVADISRALTKLE